MPAAYLLLIQFCIVIFQEWRNEEMALIDELYSGPERKAALVGLLEQEAHLIASIDRHKLVADEENKDKRIKSFLNKVCSTCVFLWCRVTYGLRNWKQPTFRDVMLESIPAAPEIWAGNLSAAGIDWCITTGFPRKIVSSRYRTAERRERQNACVRQTWQPHFLCVWWWSSLKLLFSGLLHEDLFKGGWSSAEKFFKQNYCHACHTRFAV